MNAVNMELISIVVPTHNEMGNVGELYKQICAVFSSLEGYDFELIFVDDSNDDTPKKIEQLSKNDVRVKLIRLVRSFGQVVAIAAGLKRVSGNAAIMMDADLQDPPEIIPQLIEKWKDGNKVVYVKRASSSQSFVYRFLAKNFYRILAKISQVKIPLDAGEFRLIDRTLVNFMNNLSERSRFVRGLTVWPGYKSAEVFIKRAERLSGDTKYNYRKSFGVAVDGIVSFSTVPLRLATFAGIIISLSSLLLALVYFVVWLISPDIFDAGYMSIFLLITGIGGINLFCVGVVGEYVGRVFESLQDRPLYIVDYEIGFSEEKGLGE